MKLVLIAFLIAILNQEVSHGQFFGPIKIGPGITLTSGSDTYTPADGEWPKCKGTVECKFVGFGKKCRCRKSKPTPEGPTPAEELAALERKISEGTVVCRLVGSTRHCRDIIDGIDNNNKIDFEEEEEGEDDIPGVNWVQGKVGTGSKTTIKHPPHPEHSFPSDFCQRSGWRLIFKDTKDYWSNWFSTRRRARRDQQCPPIAWYGDTCEPFEYTHMRYYPCPGWRNRQSDWCHVNPYGRVSCKSIYGWKRNFGYFHPG